MALANLNLHQPTRPSSHRTYRDLKGVKPVKCKIVSEPDIAHLAAVAARIEIRQSEGSGWIPDEAVNRIADALRALPVLAGGQVVDADVALRRVRSIVRDGIARLRVRYVLVGVTSNDQSHTVLVLVIAQRHVASCSWHIA